MIPTPMMAEIYAVKDQLAERFRSVRDIADAARDLAKSRPPPRLGSSRRMIAGFPRGQSVADDDQATRELRDVKEKLSLEFAREHLPGPPASRPLSSTSKLKSKPGFRSTKAEPKHRR